MSNTSMNSGNRNGGNSTALRNCRTCQTPVLENDPTLLYCRICGWPLGELAWRTDPDINEGVVLAGDQPSTLRILCQNVGHGNLEMNLQSLPEGVTLRQTLGTGNGTLLKIPAPRPDVESEVVYELLIAPNTFDPDATGLTVGLQVRDRKGRHRKAVRPSRREAAWRTETITIPVERRHIGLLCHQPALLFRAERAPVQRLMLTNTGDVPLIVRFTGQRGVTLVMVGRATPHPEVESKIPAKMSETFDVHLSEAALAALLDSRNNSSNVPTLQLTVPALPEESRAIHLSATPPPVAARPIQRWIVGIDFGTAKTAATILENVPGAPLVPQLVTWRDREKKEQGKVPSIIAYPRSGGRPSFGYDALSASVTDVVLRSVKKHLSRDVADGEVDIPEKYKSEPDPLEKMVSDFLREVITTLRVQPMLQKAARPGIHPLDEALIVMSLPILADPVRERLQRTRTEKAAKAAGFSKNTFEFSLEPECAAVDFLLHQDQYGLQLQQGDLLAVFDCGAGTTDICVLEVSLAGGKPTFLRRALAGFPFGGDLLDELLADAAWQHWQKVDGMTTPTPEPAATKGSRAKPTTNRDEYTASGVTVKRRDVVHLMRTLKEELRYPSEYDAPRDPVSGEYTSNEAVKATTRTYDPFLDKAYEFVFGWGRIEQLWGPYIDMMLQRNGVSAGTRIPDSTIKGGERIITDALPGLDDVLYDQNIQPTDLRYICLTGGGSFVPFIEQRLRNYFLGSNLEIVPSFAVQKQMTENPQAPHTLNVAMGAAARTCFQFDSPLPVGLALRLLLETVLPVPDAYKCQIKTGLPIHVSPPQHSPEALFDLPPRSRGVLQVVHDVAGGRNADVPADAPVYCQIAVRNDTLSETALFAELTYRSDYAVLLNAGQNIANVRTPLTREPMEVIH